MAAKPKVQLEEYRTREISEDEHRIVVDILGTVSPSFNVGLMGVLHADPLLPAASAPSLPLSVPLSPRLTIVFVVASSPFSFPFSLFFPLFFFLIGWGDRQQTDHVECRDGGV